MYLTDHTDLGLRTLVLLKASEPVRMSARQIAEQLGVSHTHIQKVVQSLQNAGFVNTFRGKSGGVQLAKPADNMRIGDVVKALEPHLNFVECMGAGPVGCRLAGGCGLTHALTSGREALLAELNRETIASITKKSPAIVALIPKQ